LTPRTPFLVCEVDPTLSGAETLLLGAVSVGPVQPETMSAEKIVPNATPPMKSRAFSKRFMRES